MLDGNSYMSKTKEKHTTKELIRKSKKSLDLDWLGFKSYLDPAGFKNPVGALRCAGIRKEDNDNWRNIV